MDEAPVFAWIAALATVIPLALIEVADAPTPTNLTAWVTSRSVMAADSAAPALIVRLWVPAPSVITSTSAGFPLPFAAITASRSEQSFGRQLNGVPGSSSRVTLKLAACAALGTAIRRSAANAQHPSRGE